MDSRLSNIYPSGLDLKFDLKFLGCYQILQAPEEGWQCNGLNMPHV